MYILLDDKNKQESAGNDNSRNSTRFGQYPTNTGTKVDANNPNTTTGCNNISTIINPLSQPYGVTTAASKAIKLY